MLLNSAQNGHSVPIWDALPTQVLETLGEIDFRVDIDSARPALTELLNRTVLDGGKRLRPMLTLVVGHVLGLKLNDIVPLARAIEQVHAASLAHDDVVDNATQRRGQDSINVQASNKRAVLAGDYLLADVIVNLTRTGNLNLVKEMSDVISALSLGEWLQMDAIEKRSYSSEILEQIFRCKTASVMSWCCLAPALFKHSNIKTVELLRAFGDHLGIAFQLMDDALDGSQASQKDQNLDIENNQVNAVVLEFLKVHPEKWKAYQEGKNLASVLEGADLTHAVQSVRAQANAKMESAHLVLDQLAYFLWPEESLESKMAHLAPLYFIMKLIIDRDH